MCDESFLFRDPSTIGWNHCEPASCYTLVTEGHFPFMHMLTVVCKVVYESCYKYIEVVEITLKLGTWDK